jgi:hypothetical protein
VMRNEGARMLRRLAKPFNLEELRMMLQEILEGKPVYSTL